jgi:hypothetical protein
MDNGLSQLITEPTHFNESSCSILDLLLISSPESVAFCGVVEPFLDQTYDTTVLFSVALGTLKISLILLKG